MRFESLLTGIGTVKHIAWKTETKIGEGRGRVKEDA